MYKKLSLIVILSNLTGCYSPGAEFEKPLPVRKPVEVTPNKTEFSKGMDKLLNEGASEEKILEYVHQNTPKERSLTVSEKNIEKWVAKHYKALSKGLYPEALPGDAAMPDISIKDTDVWEKCANDVAQEFNDKPFTCLVMEETCYREAWVFVLGQKRRQNQEGTIYSLIRQLKKNGSYPNGLMGRFFTLKSIKDKSISIHGTFAMKDDICEVTFSELPLNAFPYMTIKLGNSFMDDVRLKHDPSKESGHRW